MYLENTLQRSVSAMQFIIGGKFIKVTKTNECEYMYIGITTNAQMKVAR